MKRYEKKLGLHLTKSKEERKQTERKCMTKRKAQIQETQKPQHTAHSFQSRNNHNNYFIGWKIQFNYLWLIIITGQLDRAASQAKYFVDLGFFLFTPDCRAQMTKPVSLDSWRHAREWCQPLKMDFHVWAPISLWVELYGWQHFSLDRSSDTYIQYINTSSDNLCGCWLVQEKWVFTIYLRKNRDSYNKILRLENFIVL